MRWKQRRAAMAEAGALSLCTEQLPALLPLQHLIFQLFFPV